MHADLHPGCVDCALLKVLSERE